VNLVFASGFLVPQTLLGQDYFRDLPQKYPNALFARVSVLGSIADARRNSQPPSRRSFPRPIARNKS
jgi:hypothetical protein